MKPSRSSKFLISAAFVSAIYATPASAGQIHWVVTDVSPAAFMAAHPGVGVHAAALNNAGAVLEQTVVGRGFGAPVVDSFLYKNGAITDLDTVRPGTAAVWGTGLNDSGEVAGICNVTGLPASVDFTYAHNTLTTLPPAPALATSVVVANNGTLAGTLPGPAAAEYVGGQWQPLETVSTVQTLVSAISGNGTIAGALNSDAALWSKGKWIDLGAFPGQYAAYALAVNNHEQAAGISYGAGTVPFYWDKGHGLVPLPAPAGVTLGSTAVAGINNSGVVVGTGYGSDGVHVLGWYRGQVYDVTSQIVNTTGLKISRITGINDRFEATADASDPGGVLHPVVLTPVESAQ